MTSKQKHVTAASAPASRGALYDVDHLVTDYLAAVDEKDEEIVRLSNEVDQWKSRCALFQQDLATTRHELQVSRKETQQFQQDFETTGSAIASLTIRSEALADTMEKSWKTLCNWRENLSITTKSTSDDDFFTTLVETLSAVALFLGTEGEKARRTVQDEEVLQRDHLQEMMIASLQSTAEFGESLLAQEAEYEHEVRRVFNATSIPTLRDHPADVTWATPASGAESATENRDSKGKRRIALLERHAAWCVTQTLSIGDLGDKLSGREASLAKVQSLLESRELLLRHCADSNLELRRYSQEQHLACLSLATELQARFNGATTGLKAELDTTIASLAVTTKNYNGSRDQIERAKRKHKAQVQELEEQISELSLQLAGATKVVEEVKSKNVKRATATRNLQDTLRKKEDIIAELLCERDKVVSVSVAGEQHLEEMVIEKQQCEILLADSYKKVELLETEAGVRRELLGQLNVVVSTYDEKLRDAEAAAASLTKEQRSVAELKMALHEKTHEVSKWQQRTENAAGLLNKFQKEAQLTETSLKLKVARLEQLVLGE